MRNVRLARIWLGCAVLVALGGIKKAAATEPEGLLTAKEIIRKASTRAQTAETPTSKAGYTYTKVTVTEELDSSGNVKDRKERVYEVSFKGGSTRVKLLEVNGQLPGEAEAKKQAENEANSRQMMGSSKGRPGEGRENFLTPELVGRFDFRLIGEETVNGRKAYRVGFDPKVPEPPVRRMVDRLLNRISGTLWIDAEEFEVARADIHLRSEVNLLGGMIGSLKKLAYSMTRTRVADGVWLNSFSTGDFEGRKLLDSTRVKTKSQTSNFRLQGLPS